MKEKLFIDTNVFLYFLRKEKNWRKIARLFDDLKYSISTSILVLNELKYKLLWIAASEKLNTNKKYLILNLIKNDGKFRGIIYSKFLEFYTNIRDTIQVFDLSDNEEILSCSISNKYGLLPNDAAIIATMLNNDIKKIITYDKDFARVEPIEIIQI